MGWLLGTGRRVAGRKTICMKEKHNLFERKHATMCWLVKKQFLATLSADPTLRLPV